MTAGNARLREENARLRECQTRREAELERLHADLAVVQRLVFGRSSERSRPEPSGSGAEDSGGSAQAGSGATGSPLPGW